jgi:threonylcarbamoyladenosine tRNA methylthiotransferase MtaB
VVIVNTCAVTAEAVRKARQDIRKLARTHPGSRIVVTGCAAQTEPGTFAAMPEVAHVIGNAEKMQPATWAGLATGSTEPVQVDDIMSVTETAGHLIDGFGARSRIEDGAVCTAASTISRPINTISPSTRAPPEA